MRRLTALAITVALAWFIVVRSGAPSGGAATFALGVALIAAAIVG